MVSVEDLLERGYVEVKLRVLCESIPEFKEWCESHGFPVVDETKFVGTSEPFTIYVPENQEIMVKLAWGNLVCD